MTLSTGVRVLAAVAIAFLAVLAALPGARALDATLQGPPTLAPFDSNGDGRAEATHVTQVVHVPQGNTTATLEGYLFPPTANPNASWSGWVDAASVTQNITCGSASGCNQTFNLDLLAPDRAAGTYVVVVNVTRSPSLAETIVWGSALSGTFPTSVAADDGGFLHYTEAVDSIVAEIAYRSTTGSGGTSAPKNRTLDGSSWTSASEQVTAGSPIRAVRMAWSPVTADERIFVIQGDDGWLDAYLCTSTCNVTNDIGQVWGTAPTTAERRFDVAYEALSGEAVLAYGVLSSNTTRDIAYRTYSGGAWSAAQYVDDTGHGTDVQITLVKLAPTKGSDRIGLVAADDTNNDVNAWIWDGSAFGSATEITASARSPNEHEADLAWESASGNLVVVAAEGATTNIVSKEFTSTWTAPSTVRCVNTASGLWLSLKPNPLPTGNDMVLAVGDSGSDLSTCYWNGTGWANWTVQDTSLDFINARSFDFAWEGADSAGLLVYGTSTGQITRRTFTAPNGWGTATNAAMGTNPHRWVQLRTNPTPGAGGAKIVGAVLEDGANDLGTISWNGTAFTVEAANGLTGNTGTAAYESFDLEPGAASSARLSVRYDWTNVSAATSHTLMVTGYRADEDVDVQLLTPPSSWTTRLTISATTATQYSYTLTAAEYNGGSPSIRLTDRGGGVSMPSDLWIDWVAIRLAGSLPETTSSGTVALNPGPAVNTFGFEFGLNLLSLLVVLVPALLIAALLVRRSRRHARGARRREEEFESYEEESKPVEESEFEEVEPDREEVEPDREEETSDTVHYGSEGEDSVADEPEVEEPQVQGRHSGHRARTK